jgi:hypothetical protein
MRWEVQKEAAPRGRWCPENSLLGCQSPIARPCGLTRWFAALHPAPGASPGAAAALAGASSRRLAACFTKPSPSWPRVSRRPSGRSRKPALQAGRALLHPAQGASPVAVAGPADASSRRLAPGGWQGNAPALQAGRALLHPAQGASPVAVAGPAGASSRRLAPGGWLGNAPALQAGRALLHPAQGASPVAVAGPAGASSRRLAPGGWLHETLAIHDPGRAYFSLADRPRTSSRIGTSRKGVCCRSTLSR